jgi:copper chaperone CopZ
MSMDTSAKLVSIKVPDMHCPYGCYPKVKETLETVAGVKKVDLAPQKAGDSIDNPIVNIQLSGAFDSAAAVKALEANGWKSEVVN